MILLIDNYDSFVYNLSRYLVEMGCETSVVRNDQTTVDEIRELDPQAIVISPGPGTPQQAGVSVDVVRKLGSRVPMLGVCLGHQSIAAAFGATVVQSGEPVHGRSSLVFHDGQRVFAGLPNPLRATRYHSLIVVEDSLPDELTTTARTKDGVVMAVEHRRRPIFGVQFHPESVLTQSGHRLLANFLDRAGIRHAECPAGDFVVSTGAGEIVESPFPRHEPPTPQPLHW